MSTEEELAALGRIVQNYQQCKNRLTALVSEAHNSAHVLRKIVEALNPTNEHYDPPSKTFDATLGGTYPSQEQVYQLLSDIYAASQQKRKLELQLSGIGINVRD